MRLLRGSRLLCLHFGVPLADQGPFIILIVSEKLLDEEATLGEFINTRNFDSGALFENSLMSEGLCRNRLYGVTCVQLGPLFCPAKSCRLSVLLTLHYPAWLLTPREPCSQMEALFLWVWYRSIKY